MEDKKEEKKATEKKDKKLRSVSVVSESRRISFSKKSTSDNDGLAKRRTKSADFLAGGKSDPSSGGLVRNDTAKSNFLFSISENSDMTHQNNNPNNNSDEESIAATEGLSFSAEVHATGNNDQEFPVNDTSSETQSDLPQTRENSAYRQSGRASSVTPSETSSYTSSNSSSSFRHTTSYSNLTGAASRSSMSATRRESTSRFRRSSVMQSVPADETNNKVIKMALKREWTQLEINLRYLEKTDPSLYAFDDETGWNPLMLAARDNRIAVVERLIEMGVNINEQAKNGQAAIHFAVNSGREEIVNLLIKKRADLSLQGGEKDQLPLHIACARSGNNAVSITQAILRATSRNLRVQPDKDGNIPLFLAIDSNNQGAYRELLGQNAEEQLRYQNPRTGNTVLHVACEKRDLEMVRFFCKKGSLVNIQNKTGITALHIAASMGDLMVIECLYNQKADAGILDNQERTPLHLAAEKGHTSAVEKLSEYYPKAVLRRTQDGSTLMHIASEYGHPETALAFLRKGVPLHMPNKSGAVCLHSAAKNNHVEVVATLLKKGAHVDARTKDKFTALHVAVKHCRPLVVQVLLGYGAPVQIKGGEKQETPLHLASQINGGEQVAEMLIKSGADVNSAREDGETAIHMAARKGNLKTFKLLLDEGGDSRTQSKAGENALHIAVRHCRSNIVKEILEFLEKKFNRYEATLCVNMENKEGETPVHLAAELTEDRSHLNEEELKIVSLLLQYGGDINFCTKLTQETSLHYCARSGNERILKMFLEDIGKDHNKMSSAINRPAKNGWSPLLFASDEGNSGSVDVLLQHGARVDVFDENSKAALHLAAENGHEVIADMLIRKKAYVNAKTKLGSTPLHIAAQKGYSKLVKMLINPIGSDQKAVVDATTLDNKTPLHKAAENGQIDVCRILLNENAKVEAQDSDGQTPLHLAAENDHSKVVKMFLTYQPELVQATNKNKATCAHIAASKGSVAVIRELLNSNKESVTKATNKPSNSTALHLAAIGGHSDVIRELVLNGASLVEEDSNGMNALHLSAKHGHSNIIEVILSNKTEVESKTGLTLLDLWQAVSSKTGYTALHVATEAGNEIFAREMLHRIRANEPSKSPGIKIDNTKEKDYGFTPLHLASKSGHVSLVRMILNYPGVSVEATTSNQKLTPLHLAAKSGFVDVVHLLLSKSIDQLKCSDAGGFTCLHYAAANGHVDMASLLLGQGVEMEPKDKEGLTPLHHAAKTGSLKMVRLLTEAGAKTTRKTKQDKRIPLQFAASSGHREVVSFLLECKQNNQNMHNMLIEDKRFVVDLMQMTKSAEIQNRSSSSPQYLNPSEIISPPKKMEIIEEFILTSNAPVETAAKLSRAFYLASNREKEQGKRLLECASFCEKLAVELLEICSVTDGAKEILEAKDIKSTPFLDVLIESEQKMVVANPAVQKYLSDVWVGDLKWADWKFVLLFLAIFLVPVFWLIFSIPFQWRLNRTPIIKFLVYLASHLYLIALFIITVAVPITPIYEQGDLIPEWNEWLLLIWITGLLVNELVNSTKRTGIARIRFFVIFLSTVAVSVHLLALVYPFSTDPTELVPRLDVVYARNMLLSVAMTFAFVQLLEFLSFHYLFGPWSIIIEGLLNDLIKFGVIVMLFVIAFMMWLAAVYQPVYGFPTNSTPIVGDGDGSANARILNPLDTFQILFFAIFGLIEPDNLPPINQSPIASIYLVQIVFGLFHVITLIVLINLLIAMMSDTYQRIQAQSDTEWKFGRSKLIRNMKKTNSSPSPINLFVIAYQYGKLVLQKKCRACDVGLTHLEEADSDVTSYPETSDMKSHYFNRSNADPMTQQGHINRMSSEHIETEDIIRKNSSLQSVVDWKRIKKKYWLAKGKYQSSDDVLSKLQNISDSSNRGSRANGNPPHLQSSEFKDGAMTTRSPHEVVYDDEVS